MRSVVNFCDYFVICSGDTDRQVQAIASGVSSGLQDLGVAVGHKQGLNELGRMGLRDSHSDDLHGAWVLLDMGDVVVHVLEPKAREFYELEYLWRDAPAIDWKK